MRDVKTDAEDVDAGEAADLAAAKGGKDGVAFSACGFGHHRFAADAVSADGIAHGIGVIDAATEGQPAAPVGALHDELGHRCLDQVGDIGSALELTRDKLATTAANTGNVDTGCRCL